MVDIPTKYDEVDKSRYWLSGCRSSLDELAVESVDVISTIESVKVWELLGQFRNCSLCQKGVGGQSFHCDDCKDFDVCLPCSKSPRYRVLTRVEHFNHLLVMICYRPIAAPMYDGADLPLLDRFASVTNEKDFYLYFPLLFHDIDGMDTFTAVNRKARKEHLNLLGPADPNYASLMQIADFPTDWFVRLFGHADWQGLHSSALNVYIKPRMQIAEYSSKLAGLLQKLEKARAAKTRQYGQGDIAPTPAAIAKASSLLAHMGSYTSAPFITYSLPFNMGTELNPQIDNQGLARAIKVEEFDDKFRPSLMFMDLLGIDNQTAVWKPHGWFDGQTVKSYLLKDEYVATITSHMAVRRACLDLNYDSITPIPDLALKKLSTNTAPGRQPRRAQAAPCFWSWPLNSHIVETLQRQQPF